MMIAKDAVWVIDMNEGFEKRGYLLEKFRLFHLNDTAGVQVDYHYHDFCKLLMLCSGSGGYVADGQRYSLQAGDLVLLGSRCVHRPEFAPELPYERIIIYIDPAFLESHSDGRDDLLSVFTGERGHVLRCGRERADRLFALALELERELAGDGFGKISVSEGMLLRLVAEIGRSLYSAENSLPQPVAPRDERIRAAVMYIDANLSEELTVEDIAERVYLSKFHLMRRFKEETGQTVHEYISQRRLRIARDLIRQGETVTDVCFKVGFRSYSSFFRAYVKLFGMTPTGKIESKARENGYE